MHTPPQVNPESDNPSADFYAQGDDAGDDEDIPDAGPGGMRKTPTRMHIAPACLPASSSPSSSDPLAAVGAIEAASIIRNLLSQGSPSPFNVRSGGGRVSSPYLAIELSLLSEAHT